MAAFVAILRCGGLILKAIRGIAAFASLVALTFRRSNQYRTFFKIGAIAYGIVLIAQR